MSSSTTRRHPKGPPYRYSRLFLERCIISHHRFAIDELVTTWRYVGEEGLQRVINIDFSSQARAGIEINEIEAIYQSRFEIDSEEINAVEIHLRSGKIIRCRFNSTTQSSGGFLAAALFYDELLLRMNLPINPALLL